MFGWILLWSWIWKWRRHPPYESLIYHLLQVSTFNFGGTTDVWDRLPRCEQTPRQWDPSKPNKTHFINNRTVFDFIKLLSTVWMKKMTRRNSDDKGSSWGLEADIILRLWHLNEVHRLYMPYICNFQTQTLDQNAECHKNTRQDAGRANG